MRSRHNVLLWIGFIFLALSAFAELLEAQDSAANKRGVELFNQGNYTEALKAFDQAIAETSGSSEDYRQRARCRQRLNDLRGALTDFSRAIELDPSNVRALTARSALRRQLKDLAGAVGDINRAIEIDPKNAGAYNNRGLLRWDAKDYQGALADYDHSVALDPRQSPVFNNRGLVKEKHNDLQGALADYTKAIENNPKNADAYSNRAFCRKTMGDAQAALQDYQSALKIDPGHKFAITQVKKLEAEGLGGSTGKAIAVDQTQKIATPDTKPLTPLSPKGNEPATSMKFGDFTLRVPAGWERAPSDIEKRDKTWQVADLKGSKSIDDPLIVAFPMENAPFKNEQKRLEYLSVYKDNVRKSHPQSFLSEKITLAGVDFEQLRFKDKDGRTTFYLTPYNGANVYHIYVFRPDGQDAFPERALELLSSLKLSAPEYRRAVQQTEIVSTKPTTEPTNQSRTSPSVPMVQFKASDPCQAAKTPSGLPWQTSKASAPASPPPGIPAATLSPFLDFNKLSRVQYNGAVSIAMEAMRLLYGEMPAQDQQKFQAAWAPLFDYPTPAAVGYLNQLNPLLGQFLAGREAFTRTAGAVNIAMYDAALGVAADTRDAYIDAMARADRQGQVLRSLEAGLTQVAARIEALGNPPNPLAAKCAAQERYRRSLPAASLLDGEWLTEGGTRWYFKTIKRYPDGKILIYTYSFGWAERMAEEGIDTAKPGIEKSKDGLIVLPGMEDVINLMEEQPGGMLFTSPTTVGISLVGYFPEGERVHLVSYSTGLGQDFVFSGGTFYRAIPICDKPPVLPGHTWEGILGVARDYEAGRINRLKTAKQNFPTQIQALINCDPLNLPVAPKKRNPWDEGPYKADDPRSKLPPPPEPTPKSTPRIPKPPTEAAEVVTTQETIAYHQSMIETLNRNLQKEQAELNQEPDLERRKQLAFRAIQLQSDIQAEQDLIASYQTGQIVHTRSAFDEFAHDQFIYNIRQDAARVDAARRIAAAIEEQIEQAPEDARASLRQKSRGILDAKTIASGDVDKAAKLAQSVGMMIQGYREGQAASAEEKAIDKAEMQFYFSSAAMVAGVGVIGLGSAALAATYGESAAIAVWAPHIIGGIYGGAHGLAAGGPVEGVKQAIAWSSPFGFLATSFADGFVRAGEDPKAGWEDALWSGAKEAGTGYLIGKAMQFGAGMTGKGALAYFGEDSRLFKPLVAPGRNVTQAFAAAKMQQDVADALSLINHFKGKQVATAKMRAQLPAGSQELALAEKELKQLAASLNSSYHCKLLLKYHTHPSVRRYFSSLVDKSYEEATPEMLRVLKAQGYDTSNLRFKSCRNSSSAGSSSMDLDLALQETPGMVILKNGKAVDMAQFQKDAQQALNEAYHKVTGFSAIRSEVNLTTGVHSESYATKALLKKNVNFGQLTPEEVASIGKVLGVKMDKIQGDPVLSQIAKMQAQCRESAKEIENMLLKDLQQKLARSTPGSREAQQAQADINYWTDMLKNFRQISMQETNPYRIMELDRAIRALTGGKGTQEVSRDLARAFRSR